MSDMPFDEWVIYSEPIRWKYVYIRSLKATGLVISSTQYSNHPERNTVTVELLDKNGYPTTGISYVMTMDEAREALIPDVLTIISEVPY